MYFHSLFIFFKLLLLSRTLHRLYVHGTSYLSPTSRITPHCYYLQGYELKSCIVIYCFSYLVLFSICIYYMAYILRHLIYFTHLRATPLLLLTPKKRTSVTCYNLLFVLPYYSYLFTHYKAYILTVSPRLNINLRPILPFILCLSYSSIQRSQFPLTWFCLIHL